MVLYLALLFKFTITVACATRYQDVSGGFTVAFFFVSFVPVLLTTAASSNYRMLREGHGNCHRRGAARLFVKT